MAHTEAKARRVAVKCLVSTRQEWNVRDPKSARTIVSFITPRHPNAAIAPSSVSAMIVNVPWSVLIPLAEHRIKLNTRLVLESGH